MHILLTASLYSPQKNIFQILWCEQIWTHRSQWLLTTPNKLESKLAPITLRTIVKQKIEKEKRIARLTELTSNCKWKRRKRRKKNHFVFVLNQVFIFGWTFARLLSLSSSFAVYILGTFAYIWKCIHISLHTQRSTTPWFQCRKEFKNKVKFTNEGIKEEIANKNNHHFECRNYIAQCTYIDVDFVAFIFCVRKKKKNLNIEKFFQLHCVLLFLLFWKFGRCERSNQQTKEIKKETETNNKKNKWTYTCGCNDLFSVCII